MAEVRVCGVGDVLENSVISREVGDEVVAIYNINGTFYATEARCTHAMADLAEGTLDGEEIDVEADELLARCFQHEVDHLHGVLLVERLDPDQRKQAMRVLRRRALGD